MKKIANSAELKVFWDTFEKLYSKRITYNLHSVFVNMCNITKLHSDKKFDSILELSCGSGIGLQYLSNTFKSRRVDIYGTDISTKMLNSSYEKLKNLSDINLIYKGEKLLNNESINPIMILDEADNEDLKIFEDKKFDVILSNFSLHLVENPEKMLQESSRVLKDNGVACFSIWGRPENSPTFTIIVNSLKKFGVPLPDARTNFHISNVDKLKKMVLESGFSRFNYSYCFTAFDVATPEEFLYMLEAPNFKTIFEGMEEHLKQNVIGDILEELDTIINKQNQIFGTEAIIICCYKN
jgi:ubiquinone/menaquinone biosynthesis C-methylase UbiE